MTIYVYSTLMEKQQLKALSDILRSGLNDADNVMYHYFTLKRSSLMIDKALDEYLMLSVDFMHARNLYCDSNGTFSAEMAQQYNESMEIMTDERLKVIDKIMTPHIETLIPLGIESQVKFCSLSAQGIAVGWYD